MLLLQVACESATKTGMVMIFGEITTKAKVDYEKVRGSSGTPCMVAAGGFCLPGSCLQKQMSLSPGWYQAVCYFSVHCFKLKRSYKWPAGGAGYCAGHRLHQCRCRY